MRRSISIMAATAMAVSPVTSMGGGVGRSGTTSNSVSSAGIDDGDLRSSGRHHRQPRHRELGWIYPVPDESSHSGKSGKGSSKGSKGYAEPDSEHHWDNDGWWSDTTPSWPDEPVPSSSSYSSSGKSGKGTKSSKGSKGSKSDGTEVETSYWGWKAWPDQREPESSSSGKSGKGTKSSKGSKSGDCGGGKSGKSGCDADAEPSLSGWQAAWPDEHEPEPSYGKSGKGTKSSSKGSKSGGCDGSGKSGKSICDDDEPSWSGWQAWPDEPETSSGKSGKGSSSKGSKSGEWVYVMQWTGPSGEPAEPEWGSSSSSDEDPVGVCGAYGGGLECDDVTDYCTVIGEQAECDDGRLCYDAGLCGLGDGGEGEGAYDGVCGIAIHGGKSSALDCDMVTTMCTEPGKHAECAYGSMCYESKHCDDGKGFCSGEDGFDCDHITTYCDHVGEVGHCPLGQKCYDVHVCIADGTHVEEIPEEEEEEIPEEETSTDVLVEEEEEEKLNEACFSEGTVVDCSSWSDDGYGEAVSVPFTYTISTDGKVEPEEVITPMENAILEDVVGHIEGDVKYADFTGKISAAPEDSIADDDWCGDGHSIRCSVVKGEITIHPAGWEGDGHGIDPCLFANVIEKSMEGNDYTEVDGVTGAEYRNSDRDCSGAIVSSAATAVEDEDLSAGALFAIWLAALALIALAFLLLRKRKSEPKPNQAPAIRDDISLISNDLNGTVPNFDDPYANTTDVHQCTSKLCAVCNNNLQDPRFSPAPKRVNMKKFLETSGLCVPTTASPTGVDQTNGDFFNKESKEEESEIIDLPPDISSEEDKNTRGSIMRVPFFQAERNQPLPSVNEVAHDSEIDTELESVADDTDNTTVPPPPPLAFHPAYQQRTSAYTHRDDDEESV